MSISLSQAWVASVLLLSIRLGMLFGFSPLVAVFGVPVRIRVALVLALSIALAPLGQDGAGHIGDGIGPILTAAAAEVLNGSALALGVSIAFAAFSIAGRLIDLQIGFGMGQVLDPLNKIQMPPVSALFTYLGILLFFTADLHHLLLQSVATSLELVPLGVAVGSAGQLPSWIMGAGMMFLLGFALVFPVVLILLMVEFALSVTARNLPQMNIFMLALPIKSFVGLLALAIWLPASAGVSQRIFSAMFEAWEGLLR